MDYRNYNDYELIYEVRENSEDAYKLLIEKYKPLIYRVAKEYRRNFKSVKLELDDLVQEGFCGLLQALESYDEKSCLFYTYSSLCIHREMERLIKSLSRNKHLILNSAISIDTPLSISSELTLEDVIAAKNNIENEICDSINCKELMALKNDMPFEMSLIFELKANSFSNLEICQLLDIPIKRVEKNILKIRKIVRRCYLARR